MDRRSFIRKGLYAGVGFPLAAYSRVPLAKNKAPTSSVSNIYQGVAVAAAHEMEERYLASATVKIDALIAGGPFQARWDSLHQHQDPEWFRDAKFGIYTHWGPVTVGSSYSPGDAEWYGNQMYKPDHPAYKYHQQRFGDQHKVGYKDIIPLFTGEKFDAEAWADIFTRAGAKFAGPVASHHDNFALWNSDLTRWNSVALGLHRDIVGELARAYRRHGLRYVTTFHHGYAWRYYEPAFAFDAGDPQYSDLYTEPHNPGAPPRKHYLDKWLAEVYEVLVKYKPDLIYFDFEFREVIPPEYQQKLFATTYNWAAHDQREIGVTQKDRSIHEYTGILDFERGREDRITPYPWLDDTALGPWFYVASEPIKTATQVIGILADIVAKNGCMMLDIGPKVDGTLPQLGVDVLLEIGEWLRRNGEAIYGTRPWTIYGEGPTKNVAGASFSEEKDKPFTDQDIRFTTKGKALYAILLGWPGKDALVTSLPEGKPLWFGRIRHVQILGTDNPLQWTQDRQGLHVELPQSRPGNHAYVFKIT
ncbi:MAG: alpha-L-fucosidase [Acidobacteriia bacterium]|nr:alpha-L-fucosidase [Terriglobia bacterium]